MPKQVRKKEPEKEIVQTDKRRENGLLAIGYDVRKLTRPLFKNKKGRLHLSDLLLYWNNLFPEVSDRALPAKLTPSGVLTVNVTSAALGVELSHQMPMLIERINTFFGLPVVTGVHLKAVQKRKKAEIKEVLKKKDPETYKRLEKTIPENLPAETRKKLLEILGHL